MFVASVRVGYHRGYKGTKPRYPSYNHGYNRLSELVGHASSLLVFIPGRLVLTRTDWFYAWMLHRWLFPNLRCPGVILRALDTRAGIHFVHDVF